MTALLLAAGGTAAAGVLETDPNALSGWRGDVDLQGSAPFGLPGSVNVDLDYAVYAPNPEASHFDATFGAGADPSDGTEYVYAYQAFNRAGGSAVTALTVGLDGDEPFNMGPPLGHIGFLAGTGDVSPSTSYLAPPDGSTAPTSARWAFLTVPYLPITLGSDVLFFTSPVAPEWDSATALGAWAATGQVPSPSDGSSIPGPATLGLMSLGGLALLRRRSRC